ncbi:hypothetical protein FNV43_RR00124 [Rhamnella rubrinervis]|uniref:Uncharacterized protein n=1 Tax=Rhamnella rubrinervis TaxID=2594499 RepID=A0A8K0MS37_9ROSA|nr:hypothetical protein FNV43_RR00124 [Rhamnella rubrinervis]
MKSGSNISYLVNLMFKEGRHKKTAKNSKSKDVKKLNTDQNVKCIKSQSPEKSDSIKGVEVELESPKHNDSISSKTVKRKKSRKRNVKTGFEKFLEMDMNSNVISAEDDLELERKLTKKLKVKNGKVKGEDLGMNIFFKGIPSVLDSVEEEKLTDTEELPGENFEKKLSSKKRKRKKLSKQGLEGEIPDDSTAAVHEPLETYAEVESVELSAKVSSCKKNKKTRLLDKGEEGNIAVGTGIDVPKLVESDGVEVTSNVVLDSAPGKYIVPHLRSLARMTQNNILRLIESNVESSTGEVSIIFRSIARGIASQILSEEVLAFCSRGPRGNEQYAAVFAAFVAGVACSVGIDFSAKLMASLAKTFEDEYHKEDNLSLRNLTLLLSYLYIFGDREIMRILV